MKPDPATETREGLFDMRIDELQRSYDNSMPMRQLRHLRFIEIWQLGNWIFKVYLHSAHSADLADDHLIAFRKLAEQRIEEIGRQQLGERVGFIILAHGIIGNWIMLNWWESFHLYQRISKVEGMPPTRLLDAPPDLFQCVYDLRITIFESEAWRTHVVENPSRDLGAYLAARLNVDV